MNKLYTRATILARHGQYTIGIHFTNLRSETVGEQRGTYSAYQQGGTVQIITSSLLYVKCHFGMCLLGAEHAFRSTGIMPIG